MQLPTIPPDKAGHAIVGAVIFAAVGTLAALLGAEAYARFIGATAAALAGALKEASDYRLNQRAIARGDLPPHGVELMDFAATCGGAAFVWLAAIATGS